MNLSKDVTQFSLSEQGKPMQQACHITPISKRYSIKAVHFQCAAYNPSSAHVRALKDHAGPACFALSRADIAKCV